MDKKQTTIETYNKGAIEMAAKFNAIGPRLADIQRAFTYTNKKHPKVVEIGCGNGRDSVEILKRTSDYIGIDASNAMIDLARTTTGTFTVADAQTFDYPNQIDIVFAFASLLHFNKFGVQEILHKLHEGLSEKGIIYISVKKGLYHEWQEKGEFGDRFFYFYTRKDFRELAADQYEIVYTDEQLLKGQEWLTIILQKK